MAESPMTEAERDERIARPLKLLVPLIHAELAAGDAAGLAHFRRAGDMLHEARTQVAPLRWGTWLSKNFQLSTRTAYRYMRLAQVPEDDVPRRGTSLKGVIGEPNGNAARTAWRAAQRREREVFAQDRRTRETETRRQRDLAVELVDAGYRALARRRHPDTGGSTAAMVQLNAVRERVRALVRRVAW